MISHDQLLVGVGVTSARPFYEFRLVQWSALHRLPDAIGTPRGRVWFLREYSVQDRDNQQDSGSHVGRFLPRENGFSTRIGAGYQLPCRFYVKVHLRHEVVHRGEPHLLPQALMELDAEGLVVEIALEVQ